MEYLFACCKLLKRGPRLQNLAWFSTSQRAELIDSVVIVQVLSRSQLQNWHVVPASDFDYFWTKSRMRLELGFYIMALLSNILQMLSPEGGSTFQGVQTALKQNCFSVFWCTTRTWAALSSAHRWAGAACSPQPEHHHWESSPTAHLVLLSLCHPAKLEPSTPNSTQVSQGCRQAPQTASIMCLTANRTAGLWTSLGSLTTEATASNLGTNAQPCHSLLCQPCSRSWALTRDLPSLKPPEQTSPTAASSGCKWRKKGK